MPGQFGSSIVPVTGVTEFNNNVLSTSDILIEDDSLKVFPNPVTDFAIIQVNDILTEDLNVKVVDATGKILIDTVFVQGRTICTLDTSFFYNGTYFVQISNKKDKKILKLIVHKRIYDI